MSPDPTSPSSLVAAAITAGSARACDPDDATPAAGVARAYDGPSGQQSIPASGKRTVSPPAAALSVGATAGDAANASASSAAEASVASASTASDASSSIPPIAEPRIIKRYSNRKLYDTKSSRYVTLLQIAEMVRAGEEVQIIDNRTKEDKTEATLALIISEELKASPRGIPLATLRALIREGAECDSGFGYPGAASFEALFQVVFGRSAPGASPASAATSSDTLGHAEDGKESMKDLTDAELRANFERWCAAIDQRVRSLPDTSTITGLEARVQHLNERLAELERRLGSHGG